MSAPSVDSEPALRLADRLAAARQRGFVGRRVELELFRTALLASEPPFTVLHLYGPGGVGKTALLAEYARCAAGKGVPALRLDGRDLDPSPAGFLLGLRRPRRGRRPWRRRARARV